MSLGQKRVQINLVVDKQADIISRREGEEKSGTWNYQHKTAQAPGRAVSWQREPTPRHGLVISGFATYSPWGHTESDMTEATWQQQQHHGMLDNSCNSSMFGSSVLELD